MTCAITLADAIAALVAQKRAVGYKYDTEARVLARFEAFCRIEFPGLGTVSQASVEAWVASARRRGEVAIGYRSAGAEGHGVKINPPKSGRVTLGARDSVIVLAE